MNSLRTQAIVLRRTNYGEADRILQLITPNGRQSVMARGVRKEKSRLAGGIELFALSDVVVGKGKGDLGILTSARLVQFYRHIMQDYERLQFGYEVIKQVARASEMVDEPEWFETLLEVLMALDSLSVDRRLIESWFYLRHAALLGRSINLNSDVSGKKLQPSGIYVYDSSENGLQLAKNGDITSDHIKLLRLIDSKSLRVLAQIGGIEHIIGECLMMTRQHAAI